MSEIILNDKIALIGDPHIGVNKNSEEFFKLTEEWFEKFIDFVNNRNITDVFVLGDWHHYRDEISVKTLDFSSRILRMFPDNIRIFMLTGNHDCYLKDTSEIHSLQPYKGWKNITIFDSFTRINFQCGKSLSIVPWGEEIDERVDKSDYIFGHFEINNFRWNSFTVCDNGIDSNTLTKDGAKVFTGHFHKRQHIKYTKGEILYVGSMLPHNFNDVSNEHGFHILDATTGDAEFIKNEGFPEFKYIKLSKIDEVEENEIKNNYVKLFLDGIDIDQTIINSSINKLQSYLPRIVLVDDKSQKSDSLSPNIDLNIDEINILKSIKEYIDTLDDNIQKDKIYDYIETLYNKHNQ